MAPRNINPKNKQANFYWEKFNLNNSNTRWILKKIRESFAKYIPPNSKVLEIGCGTGNILTYIAKTKNCKCYGIDISPLSQKLVSFFEKERKTKVNFLLGDAFNLPFKNNFFDVVYSEGVIEHFSPKKTEKLIKEHIRVCKRGGLIIISVPNKYNLPHTLWKAIVGKKYKHYPERSYSINELKKILEKNNTKIIAQDGIAWQQGFAHWRIIKKIIYLIKYLPHDIFPSTIRSYIGFECMAIASKNG